MAEWLQNPTIGQWYQTEGEPFEIVGIDDKAEVVLVQHFDGALEEFDVDSWQELNPQPCAPPEDYSGALDIEREDYGVDLESDGPGSRDNPLDLLDSR